MLGGRKSASSAAFTPRPVDSSSLLSALRSLAVLWGTFALTSDTQRGGVELTHVTLHVESPPANALPRQHLMLFARLLELWILRPHFFIRIEMGF